MRIKRIYEFLELDKSYDYQDITRFNGYKEFIFKADDGEEYCVLIVINNQKDIINITWYNKKDANKFDIIDEKTSKTININTLFKIINTVFKIVFDTMKKENSKTAKIGSRNKNKFKIYKQSIGGEKDFKIIDEWVYGTTNWIRFEYLKAKQISTWSPYKYEWENY